MNTLQVHIHNRAFALAGPGVAPPLSMFVAAVTSTVLYSTNGS